MAKITYTNKVTLNPQPSIADENKVTSGDMNEIKSSVNTLYDNQGDLSSLQTTTKSSLVGAINELSSWTKLGSTITGSTSIDISSIDYRELYIRVLLKTSSSDGGISLEFYIIKDVLTSTNASFRKGYFDTTTTCGSAYVNASTSSISLNYGTRNGSNCTSTSTIDVYYK